MKPIISPSILSADFGYLARDIEMINRSEAEWVHIDIMDGVFVPNISFGFPVLKYVAKLTDKPLDVHLMIVNPEKFIPEVKALGAHTMNVHYEACTHLHRVIQQIKEAGMQPAVTINPATPVALLQDIIQDVYMVLIMSVNPGFGGQKFIEHSVEKVRELRALIERAGSKALIEVDGGVNLETGARLVEAGADVLVAGNAVFGAPDPPVTQVVTDTLNTASLHQYPYIRLIIPWIAGVFCGDWFFDQSTELFWSILNFGLFAGLCIALYFLKRRSLRWCFGISVFALCFAGGWLGITCQLKQTVYDFPEKEAVYRVRLTDTPETKERTLLCRVLLKELRDSSGVCPIGRKAILYLQKDSLFTLLKLGDKQLKIGDELLVSARIAPPANGGNFDEFDYARYLMRHGISGTGYVASGKWALWSPSIRYTAMFCQEKVINLYRKLGFEGDELAVLSALTVGEKTDLSDSIRESYSVSGASHVLALSGLHIGLLYALLFLLLKPLTRKWQAGRYFRSVLLLVLLWSFAFFTGLSPSVVRSVSMFSVLAIAELFGRQSLTLNTLAATAWVMLFVNPAWLFDVGFQLSFLAVLSILMIQKPVYQLLPVKSRIGKYVWGLMSVSIAAQIGTAPLVMLYFSRFSTHFLLTNLVVIPLVTVTLYAAVLMLLLTPLPAVQFVMAGAVRFLLKVLNDFVRWVEQLPYASLDGIWLYRLEVLGIYIFLLLFLYYLKTRRFRNLVVCFSCLLCLGIYHTVMRWYDRPCPSLVFYNVRGCPAIHCIAEDGTSWLNYADTLSDKRRLQAVAANYWRRHQLLPPIEVTADCQNVDFCRHQQIVFYHGCRICMVTDNRWRNKSAASPLFINYMYLCKGYNGRLEELTGLFSPSCILLDASLSDDRKQFFREECKRLHLHFITLSEEGSVRFLL